MEYKIGSIVRTKKQHPCGSKQWELIRIGVDFKLKCLGCGHIVTMEREKAKKAIYVLGGKIIKIDKLKLPEGDNHRTIILIEKIKNTPSKYPRKAGTPSKEPIC